MAELHNRNLVNNEVPAPLTFKIDPDPDGRLIMTKESQGTLKMADKIVIIETENAEETRADNPNWKERTYRFTFKYGDEDMSEEVQANNLKEGVETFLYRKGWTPARVETNESTHHTTPNFTVH